MDAMDCFVVSQLLQSFKHLKSHVWRVPGSNANKFARTYFIGRYERHFDLLALASGYSYGLEEGL